MFAEKKVNILVLLHREVLYCDVALNPLESLPVFLDVCGSCGEVFLLSKTLCYG